MFFKKFLNILGNYALKSQHEKLDQLPLVQSSLCLLIFSGQCISQSCIKIKINLNFYFHTFCGASKGFMKAFFTLLCAASKGFYKGLFYASLWCLKRFYEGLFHTSLCCLKRFL